MHVTREELLKLLELVSITRPQEIDCDEFLGRVAGLLDRVALGESPISNDDALLHHLKICPECLEEYEALYRALRNDREEAGDSQSQSSE